MIIFFISSISGRSRRSGGLAILLGMDKICNKETTNAQKTKIMLQAIEMICDMPIEEIRTRIRAHQQKVLKEAELNEEIKAFKESQTREVSFSMVCIILNYFHLTLVLTSNDETTFILPISALIK